MEQRLGGRVYSPTGTAGRLLFVCWLLVCLLSFIGLCVCLGVVTVVLAGVNMFN